MKDVGSQRPMCRAGSSFLRQIHAVCFAGCLLTAIFAWRRYDFSASTWTIHWLVRYSFSNHSLSVSFYKYLRFPKLKSLCLDSFVYPFASLEELLRMQMRLTVSERFGICMSLLPLPPQNRDLLRVMVRVLAPSQKNWPAKEGPRLRSGWFSAISLETALGAPSEIIPGLQIAPAVLLHTVRQFSRPLITIFRCPLH